MRTLLSFVMCLLAVGCGSAPPQGGGGGTANGNGPTPSQVRIRVPAGEPAVRVFVPEDPVVCPKCKAEFRIRLLKGKMVTSNPIEIACPDALPAGGGLEDKVICPECNEGIKVMVEATKPKL